MSRLEIVSVAQYNKAVWQVQKPIPSIMNNPEDPRHGQQVGGVEGTQIDKIILLGGNVEIFGRSAAAPGRGFHRTLCTPTVSLLTSVVGRAQWQELLLEVDTRETVEEVEDGLGKTWRLNEDVPDQPGFTIVRMAMLGDSVEVFVAPKAGHPLDRSGICLHFRLMPFFIQSISASAELSNWTTLQAEFAELADEEENDDDDDDDDLDPNEELEINLGQQPVQPSQQPFSAPVAAMVPPPPPMNGASVAPAAPSPPEQSQEQ